MNQNNKRGELIRFLRKRQALTQLQLAEILCVSDKAVSKWERGAGSPDINILPGLAEALGTDTEALLSGELPKSGTANGNLKKLRFYVCPRCGNLMTSLDGASIRCCGQRLSPLAVQQEDKEHRIIIEESDGDWFCFSPHEMERSHYISFIAFASENTVSVHKLYPEWSAETRFPRYNRGNLLFYCTKHGLFIHTQ